MKKITMLGLSVIIVGFMLAFIIIPKKYFSENENRVLMKFPDFDTDDLLEGEYTFDISQYLSDHFPLRDSFVGLKNIIELNVLRNSYINGIYVCRDRLIEDYKEPENTDKIIDIINSFNEKVNTDLMLVPTAVSVYKDELPKNAEPYDQNKVLDYYYSRLNTNNIDLRGAFENAKEDTALYYKYDHHWTSDAAYIAYREYCDKKGFEPISKDKFEIDEVDGFFGTIYSKLNYKFDNGDIIKIYENKNSELQVSYDGKSSDSLFDMSYANKKDKYSIFLSNLHSFIEITNEKAQTDRELVVIKDSYANCLVPFLAEHYKRTYVFDPRSYKGSISDFVKEHKAVDVLMVYNLNTIDTDTGIKAVY